MKNIFNPNTYVISVCGIRTYIAQAYISLEKLFMRTYENKLKTVYLVNHTEKCLSYISFIFYTPIYYIIYILRTNLFFDNYEIDRET